MISALTKLSTTQEQMEKQLNEVKTQMSEQKKISHEPSPATQTYGNMKNQQHNATPNTPSKKDNLEEVTNKTSTQTKTPRSDK